MDNERFEIGDHVRIVNYIANPAMPVGIIENIDGAYHYVRSRRSGETTEDKCVFEVYPNEMVKITEQEYFKLLLKGVNEDGR